MGVELSSSLRCPGARRRTVLSRVSLRPAPFRSASGPVPEHSYRAYLDGLARLQFVTGPARSPSLAAADPVSARSHP